MPSPLGHALAGVAAGLVLAHRPIEPDSHPPTRTGVAGTRRRPRGRLRRFWARNFRFVVLFAAAGMAADLDLVFGHHRGPTHGLSAALLAAMIAFAATRRWRFGAALGAAYASHTLLDWLGTDSAPPIGIMALWPFSSQYYESSAHIFHAISRRYWLPDFWTGNLRAVAREVVVLLPLTALVAYVRNRAS